MHVDDVGHHVESVGVEEEPEEPSSNLYDLGLAVVSENGKIKCHQG